MLTIVRRVSAAALGWISLNAESRVSSMYAILNGHRSTAASVRSF